MYQQLNSQVDISVGSCLHQYVPSASDCDSCVCSKRRLCGKYLANLSDFTSISWHYEIVAYHTSHLHIQHSPKSTLSSEPIHFLQSHISTEDWPFKLCVFNHLLFHVWVSAYKESQSNCSSRNFMVIAWFTARWSCIYKHMQWISSTLSSPLHQEPGNSTL